MMDDSDDPQEILDSTLLELRQHLTDATLVVGIVLSLRQTAAQLTPGLVAELQRLMARISEAVPVIRNRGR